jgi:hypothetical protein
MHSTNQQCYNTIHKAVSKAASSRLTTRGSPPLLAKEVAKSRRFGHGGHGHWPRSDAFCLLDRKPRRLLCRYGCRPLRTRSATPVRHSSTHSNAKSGADLTSRLVRAITLMRTFDVRRGVALSESSSFKQTTRQPSKVPSLTFFSCLELDYKSEGLSCASLSPLMRWCRCCPVMGTPRALLGERGSLSEGIDGATSVACFTCFWLPS